MSADHAKDEGANQPSIKNTVEKGTMYAGIAAILLIWIFGIKSCSTHSAERAELLKAQVQVSTAQLQAQQPVQTLNTAQLAQQAPGTPPVSTNAASVASAKGQPLLCGPAAAVGLARMFIPRDSGCPQRAPAPGITPLDEDSPTGIQQAQGVGETDHEHPEADVNWGHPVQAYRFSELVPTDALPSAEGYHAECWDMARRTYVNLEKEACTPKEAGGYRFQCPAGQSTCEIPYIWRPHTS